MLEEINNLRKTVREITIAAFLLLGIASFFAVKYYNANSEANHYKALYKISFEGGESLYQSATKR